MANELKVDVLAVMDAAIDRVARPHEAGLHAARAAVAELMERNRLMEKALRAIDATFQANGGIGRYSFPANGDTAALLLHAVWHMQGNDAALAVAQGVQNG